MARTLPHWTLRAVLGIVVVLGIAWMVLGWMHANAIRAEFLLPGSHDLPDALEVITNDAGRIVLPRNDDTVRVGVWGVDGDDGYAQMATIVQIGEDTVERGVRTLEGEIAAGDTVTVDVDAFTGDPRTAHGIGFEDLVIPAEIGPHGAWFVDGRRATWVIFVHGRGDDRLTESLRLLPALVEEGYPVMVMSYRNDVQATPSDSGMRMWGLEEWKDVEAAVQLAERKGARDVVLFGSGFGSSVVSSFLHESPEIGAVRGAIFESPMLDFEDVVARWASDDGTPRVVAWLGRRLASVRFGLEWGELDQVARMEEFDVPMLVLAGGGDPVTDPEVAEEFADGLGERARFVRFEQAAHADLWNTDADRYERLIVDWLAETVGTE
jgi:pimeloyl-ACP methyl ester carboxylesterase